MNGTIGIPPVGFYERLRRRLQGNALGSMGGIVGQVASGNAVSCSPDSAERVETRLSH